MMETPHLVMDAPPLVLSRAGTLARGGLLLKVSALFAPVVHTSAEEFALAALLAHTAVVV